ncbi:MAG: PIG-L deacetylase family protein [Planctomycetota bacterium]|jgi:LmbE family N-acetylglucosaminyl deacetylase
MALIRNATGLEPLCEKGRRILAVFPHPDDESYGPAGTLFRIGRDPDAATAVYIMTRGEASSIGPQRGITPDEVAHLRRERLGRVDAALGLDALLIGDFPDGGMAHRPLREMADAIGSCLDALRPQVVIAHDARGVNAHPDHIATHWAVRAAVEERPGIRLAMLAYPQETADAVKPRLLFPTPDRDVDCVVLLEPDEIDAKEACLDIHEAIVTMKGNGSDGRIVRPPVERYSFLRESMDPPGDDLFRSG